MMRSDSIVRARKLPTVAERIGAAPDEQAGVPRRRGRVADPRLLARMDERYIFAWLLMIFAHVPKHFMSAHPHDGQFGVPQ
jgi:hypothetical protein